MEQAAYTRPSYRISMIVLIVMVAGIALTFTTGCGGLNGTYIEPPQGARGLCSLIVVNNYDDDIVVKLYDVANPGMCLHYVYVSARRQTTIAGIAPGNLTMKYSKGKEWNPVTRMFNRDRVNYETDQILKFEETVTEEKTSEGVRKNTQYSVQSFTLNPSSGESNTTTSQIDDAEFRGK